jgi:hypothetical protein
MLQIRMERDTAGMLGPAVTIESCLEVITEGMRYMEYGKKWQ